MFDIREHYTYVDTLNIHAYIMISFQVEARVQKPNQD